MSTFQPGQSLLHYRITGKIGQGGMGEVYKAEDTLLGRSVAIKFLAAEAMQDERAKRRLLQEARSASALNHPHIVTIHSIHEQDGLDFIVMEYVEGETLQSYLQRGPLPLTLLMELGAQVSDALDAAHSVSVIHRDIKPANIIITRRGQAKVLDFGLAKMIKPLAEVVDKEAPTLAADLTGEGAVVGTVLYMSPEQTRGESLDARSDIFSFGSVLYEAATGRQPFTGPSLLRIMHEISAVDPPPPSSIRRELPREFDLVIERALAKQRERRYASASEMHSALRALTSAPSGSFSGFGVTPEGPTEAEHESFVGREDELKRLDEFLQQTVKGSGRVIFITGEPGIGKTAFTDEFLRRSRKSYPGLLFSRGRCVEQYGTGEAYLPFLDGVGALVSGPGRERIAAVLRTFAPTWCLQLPAAFASTGALEKLQQETIGATKERMLREMGDALGAMSAYSPIVLILEDLHWADPSSIDLLRHLCQRTGEQHLMIVGTFRPEEVELSSHPLKTYKLEMKAHNQCEEIALAPLGEEHIIGYLNSQFEPNDFPRDLSSLIQRKTEGHPLFATSLVQYMAERGDIARVNEHWSLTRPLSEMDLEAPESVRSMLRKKIDALDEEDRKALQYASIEGEEFLSTIVAELLDQDEIELEERLAKLERLHRMILTRGEEELPDGSLATRYRFAHALYQNVLYTDLVTKRRILLHRQAGERLSQHYGKQSPRIATQLALHFERGRDFGRAIEYLTHAGDNATKLYGNAEAAEHYGRALDLVEKLPEEARAEKYLTLNQKRGAVNMALSRFPQAVDDFTKMLDQARALGSLEQESAALNALTTALFFSHRLDETVARAGEALAVAERAGNEKLRAETMALVGLKQLCYGELAEAEPVLDDVIRTARSLNHKPSLLSGLAWRSALHFWQSEYRSAVELAEEARCLASELRDGFMLMTSLFFLGLAQGNLGRMSEALETLNLAIQMAKRNGDLFWFPRMPNCIGWIHRELQDFDGAFKYDRLGLQIGQKHSVLEAESNSLINLGIDHTYAGDGRETLKAFHQAEDNFNRDAWFRWRYNIRLQAARAEYWLSEGEVEKAEEFARRALETATHYGAHKYIATSHSLMAQAAIARGDLAEGETQLKIALDELGQYPSPLVAWKTYAALGRLRLQSGDEEKAREAFAHSADIVRSIASHVADESLRAKFLNSPTVREILEKQG